MQLHDMVTVYIVTCSNLVFYYQFIHKNISSINELTYRRNKTSFEWVNGKW